MRYTEILEACWKGYRKDGMKTMFGKRYPNCVKVKKQSEGVAEAGRVARKPGQPANSKKHSDLYTDENPRGTITGLKFATPEDARASVTKIRNSGRSHAHRIQAAVAMEQRARAAGKASAAAVYRRYINANKKTNEEQLPETTGALDGSSSARDAIKQLLGIDKSTDAEAVKAALHAIGRDTTLKSTSKARLLGQIGTIAQRNSVPIGPTYYNFIRKFMESQPPDFINKNNNEQQLDEKCWDGYTQQGMKKKGDRQVPNCVPVSEQQMEEDLKKWFKEKWVRFGPDGKIRGDCARGSSKEGKPKCLPQAKAQALGKKGRAASAAKKRRQDPNPERRGAAKNVATKVRESLRSGEYYIAQVTLDTGEVKRVKVTSDEGYDDAIRRYYAGKGRQVVDIDMDFDIQSPVREQSESIPTKSIIQGYTVFFDPSTLTVSVTKGGVDADAAIEQERISKPTMLAFNSAVYRMISRIEDETEPMINEGIPFDQCPSCGGPIVHVTMLREKQDACYHKVKSRYKVWPSAYASGALVQCRKKGAANWGNKGK